MTWLHRFAPDGRYLGRVLYDEPQDRFAGRTDLTPIAPPARQPDHARYFIAGGWQQVYEPAPSPPPPPEPEQQP